MCKSDPIWYFEKLIIRVQRISYIDNNKTITNDAFFEPTKQQRYRHNIIDGKIIVNSTQEPHNQCKRCDKK